MPLTLIQITGDDVHDSQDTDRSPIKIGGKASAATPTAVTAGDRVNAYFDLEGYQHVKVDGTVTVSGGGTAYTEGDIDASFSGNVALAEGAADTARPIQVFELGSNYALKAAIVDGSGNQITSFGGGTQYTEGDTDATIVGTAIMFESNTGTNTISVVNSTTPLPVADTAAETSLAIIDDWDETDRAKVNPIVGQAGVQGGSGTVSANTQRVVLATDVALPAGTNAIGKLSANSGVDIGDVDVTSVIPGIAGTNLGKQSNVAAGAGDTCVATVGIRNDSNNTFAGADLRYGQFSIDISGAQKIIGKVAHGTAVDSRPVSIGQEARTTNPTAVSDGQTARNISDDIGRSLVLIGHARDLQTQTTTDITSVTTETILMASGGSGIFYDIASLDITNYSQFSCVLSIRDATAGSVVYKVGLAPKQTLLKSFPRGAG